MIVIDTSVWIDYVNGVRTAQTDILGRALQESRVVTGDLIMVEFLQGFRDNNQFQIAKKLMDALKYYDFVGKEMSIKAAQNIRLLRKKGVTVRKTNDVFIATFCIEHGFELLHNEKDYEHMEEILELRVKR